MYIIDPDLRSVLMFSSIVPSLIIFVPDYSSRQTKTRWVKTIGALFYSSVRFNFTIYHKLVAAKYDDTDLTADSVAKMISISNQPNSQVFSVNVKSSDPKMSKDIANTIAEVFKDKVASIMSVSNVSIVSKAMTNSKPVAPNVKLITLAGFVLGVFAGFAWGFIKEVTDRTVKDLEFLTDELKLTNLGVIRYIGKIRDVKDVVAANEKKNTSNETRTSRLGKRI